MILLAIDTATESCSAALWVNDRCFHRSTLQPRMHAELILPFVDELLQEANIQKQDLQGLVVGQGPGAFTGVRIGVAVTQGLALALDIPIVAVSNLETLAFAAYRKLKTTEKRTVLVATDARMNEVYWAKYTIQDDHIKALTDEQVCSAKKVDLTHVDAYIGSGFGVYPELQAYSKQHTMPFETTVYSHAKDMLLMVKDRFNSMASTIEVIEPIYLREP
ncbi:MAG: tRNA (adenosine(37)-N6)-threonylcarbamoyltransferase complex dimerization subunit type 1 TsaB [Proteobacteria bacterium]|nr:tRNA (adenosine(37)-N6)-threonylcarbamoyltransferase complex dimerization subunit type 1 TsaB [Pseudomonadota bacterium]